MASLTSMEFLIPSWLSKHLMVITVIGFFDFLGNTCDQTDWYHPWHPQLDSQLMRCLCPSRLLWQQIPWPCTSSTLFSWSCGRVVVTGQQWGIEQTRHTRTHIYIYTYIIYNIYIYMIYVYIYLMQRGWGVEEWDQRHISVFTGGCSNRQPLLIKPKGHPEFL